MAKRGRPPKQKTATDGKPSASAPTAKPAAAAEGETISGYFRQVFKDQPHLLDERSNDELLARWKTDHPGKQDLERVRQNLSNIKSVLRNKRRRKRGRKAKAVAGASPVETPSVVMAVHPTRAKLEALEENIDDCLTMAKNLDREGLDSVIKVLRRARNEVVWKLGQ